MNPHGFKQRPTSTTKDSPANSHTQKTGPDTEHTDAEPHGGESVYTPSYATHDLTAGNKEEEEDAWQVCFMSTSR